MEAYRELAGQGMVSQVAVRQQEDHLLGVQQQIEQSHREVNVLRNLSAQVHEQFERLTAESRMTESDLNTLSAQFRERVLNIEKSYGARLVAPTAINMVTNEIENSKDPFGLQHVSSYLSNSRPGSRPSIHSRAKVRNRQAGAVFG
jgi:hypothetical protein